MTEPTSRLTTLEDLFKVIFEKLDLTFGSVITDNIEDIFRVEKVANNDVYLKFNFAIYWSGGDQHYHLHVSIFLSTI
jgi:hypothetical protein